MTRGHGPLYEEGMDLDVVLTSSGLAYRAGQQREAPIECRRGSGIGPTVNTVVKMYQVVCMVTRLTPDMFMVVAFIG